MFRTHALALLLVLVAACCLPPAAYAQRGPVRSPALFTDALELYHNRLYVEATRAFKRFRARYPENVHAVEALYYQAHSELALGHDERAIALFERLQVTYPAHPLTAKALPQVGRYFIEQEAYDRARAVFERMLERRPNGPQAPRALYALGQTARMEGDYTAAASHFQEVVDKFPGAEVAPEALYGLAASQVQQENYSAAARSLEQLARRYPEAPQAQTLGLALAEVYYELGHYEQAIGEIDGRLEQLQGREQARAIFLKAESHHQLDQREAAITSYRRYVENHPQGTDYRAALYGLAWNYFQGENYREAAERFSEVRQGSSDRLTEQATYYEAVSRQEIGQPDAALSLYQAVSRQAGTESTLADQALYAAARLHYAQERWAAAAGVLERLLDEYPESARHTETLILLGHVRAAEGEFQTALDRYEQVAAQGDVPAAMQEQLRFQRAWILYRMGRHADAAEAFSQFLDAFPQSNRTPEARFWAAESFFQTGALDQAKAFFWQYLNDHPGGSHSDAARYTLAWAFFKQGRYLQAARHFNEFLQSYDGDSGDIPYETDARLRLGDSYYALKQYGRAAGAYNAVTGANRDYALYQTAQAFYFAGRRAEAINTLQRLQADYPQSELQEEAHFRIGDIQFENQEYDAAIATYRALIEAHPNDPLAARAQYGIGDAYYNAGRLDAAVRAYREVLSRYPNSPFVSNAASSIQYARQAQGAPVDASSLADSLEASGVSAATADELRFSEAEVAYESGRFDEALRAFQRFIRTASNEQLLASAYYYLGLIYTDRGDFQAAETYLQQVVENYPESLRRLDAAARLGAIYRRQSRPEAALQAYHRMEDLAEDDAGAVAEARYGQSLALMELGRTDEAQQLLQGILETAPDAPETAQARLGLARLYERQGRMEEALQLYRQVAQEARGETGAESLYRLGSLLLTLDQPRTAIEELSRLPALFSGYAGWVARGYLAQAQAFRQLGRPGDAARLYDRVLSEFAGTTYAETAAEEKAAL